MEDAYSKSGWQRPGSGVGPPIFIHYHESAYLMDALQRHGMEVLLHVNKDYQGSDGVTAQDLILVAKLVRKNAPS